MILPYQCGKVYALSRQSWCYGCNWTIVQLLFADTGRRLGIEPMYLYAQKFGLGEYTGVEIEESKGTLAGRDSTDWQVGNTVSAAIGQSDNAFTPVQLATYVATIANNGERLKTHIVDKVTNYERTKTVNRQMLKATVIAEFQRRILILFARRCSALLRTKTVRQIICSVIIKLRLPPKQVRLKTRAQTIQHSFAMLRMKSPRSQLPL